MKELTQEVADYYSAKLAEHGATPRGVDWNGEASQQLRFEQLARLFDPRDPCSINDLGCGYGALYDFLQGKVPLTGYCGIDLSQDMIAAAQIRYGKCANARFLCAPEPDQLADYGIASGIFNVKQSRDDTEWLEYIKHTLGTLDRTSSKGFAFNCLTGYSDAERMRSDLYYGDPGWFFDFCKRNFSRNVALLHDYDLYEFTILVRK